MSQIETTYRIDHGSIAVTTTDADAAEQASRDGATVTAVSRPVC